MATVKVTKENFEDVMKSKSIVMLDFWANWCAPCKAFGPVFEAASNLHPEMAFGKIDTEAEPELAELFGIRSIPTLVVFRDDIGVFSQAGALPPQVLEDLIGKVKALDMEEVRRSVAEQETQASGTQA